MASTRNVSMGVFGILIIGILAGNVAPSVLSSRNLPVGSTLNGGNVGMVTANRANSSVNNNPSVIVDSGSVKTWPSSGGSGIPGGGVRLSASGSRFMVANFLVPTTYASGAILDGFSVEGNNVPKRMSGSIVLNQPSPKSAVTTGTLARSNIFIGSGSYTMANTGAIIQTKLTAGSYYSFILNGDSAVTNTSVDVVVKPILHEKYGR